MLRILVILSLLYVVLIVLFYYWQRSLLYFPSHDKSSSKLKPWPEGGRVIAWCREAPNPHTIWFMTHGNAGRAADRDYVLRCLSDQDSLYVLEYPGYGDREGSPSREAINQAAVEGYQMLRKKFPTTPVCAIGESLGSGPACMLAGQTNPPDKIVLVVPFDILVRVASEKFRYLPVWMMLRDRWNNVEALRSFKGPVDIFGAIDDKIIPIKYPKALADQVRQSHFTAIDCGHNDWCLSGEVNIRR